MLTAISFQVDSLRLAACLIELGILAGRLYFEFSEYVVLCKYLGLKRDQIKPEGVEFEKGLAEVADNEAGAETIEEEPVNSDSKVFCKKHLEFLALRRKGQDVSHTPMGHLCQGKPLLEGHPFFAKSVLGTKKEVHHAQRAGCVRNVTEDDVDEDVSGDDGYGEENCAEEADNYDDNQLIAESDSGSGSGSDEP